MGILNENEIKRICSESGCKFDIHTVDEVRSTNDELKRLAADGCRDGYVLIADRQSAGRGRMGHSFFSPGSGVYLSVVLRPGTPPSETCHLTAAAGIAVCSAIEKLTDHEAKIKWVNDVYISGRKVCGILTESSIVGERTAWAVVGIGVNITEPENGFPEEIKHRACALFTAGVESGAGFRERFVSELLVCFEKQISLPWEDTLAEYRRRSYLTGREVTLSDGSKAVAVDISEDGSLVVETSDGERKIISSQFSVKE